MYFVVKNGSEELLTSTIKELQEKQQFTTEDIMVTRSLLEAQIKQKHGMVTTLESAGVVLTEAAVYWTLMDHGFDEIGYVINSLKRNETLDAESLRLAWGVAKAMEHEDKRFIEYLKAEDCVVYTVSLVYAMTAGGQNSDQIYAVIEDLKNQNRWDPAHLHICCAYMHARKRSDKHLQNILEDEGVRLCSGCFLYAYNNFFPDEVNEIFETVSQNREFGPDDEFFNRALIFAIQKNDRLWQDKLAKIGIQLNMVCLMHAVDPVFYPSTFELVVKGIKAKNNWNCNCDDALRSLNKAVKRRDKHVFERLLAEGLHWKTRNLCVAVQHETVWGLKQVVKYMRSVNLLDTQDVEIKNAVQLANSMKDKRKFSLLLAEKIGA